MSERMAMAESKAKREVTCLYSDAIFEQWIVRYNSTSVCLICTFKTLFVIELARTFKTVAVWLTVSRFRVDLKHNN